jgi:hypothetical protein
VLFGLVLTGVSTWYYTGLSGDTSVLMISIMLAIGGAGLGAVMVPAMAITVRGLGRDMIPRATTASRILMQLGGSFGAAVVLIVLQTQITEKAKAGQMSPDQLGAAFGHTFWWILAFAVAALIPAALTPGTKPKRPDPAQAAARQAAPPAEGLR